MLTAHDRLVKLDGHSSPGGETLYALGRVGGSQPPRMGADQVGLHQSACIAIFGQQVDMHLVGAAFRALVGRLSVFGDSDQGFYQAQPWSNAGP